MQPDLDPDLLTTYLAVLEHGRIAAAARATHLSQPAVSARMQRLERTLGTTLLRRSARGVTPTPAGLRLAGHARELRALLDRAVREVRGTEDLGTLAILASTTIASQVLPRALAAYRQQYPHVDLKLRIGNTDEVSEAVRAGDFPLGLVEGNRRVKGIELRPWVDDELLLVVGRTAPTAWRPRTAAELAELPLLWREPGSGTRAVLARALRSAGARGKPQPGDLVLGSNEAITSGVAAGLGVAFLSRWSLGPHLATGDVQVVAGFEPTVRRTFHWALPKAGITGTAAHFLEFATRHPPALA